MSLWQDGPTGGETFDLVAEIYAAPHPFICIAQHRLNQTSSRHRATDASLSCVVSRGALEPLVTSTSATSYWNVWHPQPSPWGVYVFDYHVPITIYPM